jgi:peptidoglycan/xylan/chitin deacetylase (PgdA/CDA1 family)
LRNLIFVLLLSFFGILSPQAAPSSRDAGSSQPKSLLVVLCYHNVDLVKPEKSPYSVTSAQFVDELNAFKAKGFQFVSEEEVKAFYLAGKPLPPLSVLVTFDDGHANIYEKARPILKRMNIPWMLFIFPTAIGGGHEKGFMDWSEVRTLQKEGVAIGSHAYDHPYLTKPGKEISTPEAYESWLDKELVHSRQLIEEKLGSPISSFAAPFGALNEVAQRHIQSAGYALAFNVFGSNNDAQSEKLELNRIIVLASDTPETLVKKATERPLHFSKTSPGSLQVVGGPLKTIAFSLSGIENYLPGSFRVMYNGSKVEILRQDGPSFSFDIPTPDRSKGIIVTVYAHDLSGANCSQSFYFIYATAKPIFLW